MGDAGAAMQRAQDKVAEMQARSGALDELLASGALTDLTSTNDDIQAQLDKAKGVRGHRRPAGGDEGPDGASGADRPSCPSGESRRS